MILSNVVGISNAIGQSHSIKEVKKAIPVKRIQNVEVASFDKSLFIYSTDNDRGLWDQASKSILMTGLKSISPTRFKQNWLSYQTSEEYGIFDLRTRVKLVSASTPIHLALSTDSLLVNIINDEIIGFLDLGRDKAYYTPFGVGNKELMLFEDSLSTHRCKYYGKSKTVLYIYEYENEFDWIDDDGEEDGFFKAPTRLLHQFGYAWEDNRAFNTHDGRLLLENVKPESVEQHGEFLTAHRGRIKNYYDKDLKVIYAGLIEDKFTLNHFKRLFDSSITRVNHVGGATYLCTLGSGDQFFSVEDLMTLSPVYDQAIAQGRDLQVGGYSYFTHKKDSGYGIYNSKWGEILSTKYTTVEKLIVADGTIRYRADNELYFLDTSNGNVTREMWEPASMKKALTINHLNLSNEKLILSLAARDINNSSSELRTVFKMGAGILDLKNNNWLVGPDYHSLFPFKDYFIGVRLAEGYVANNASWLQTVIFDQQLNPVFSGKGMGVVYNSQLFIYDGSQVFSYDIESQKMGKSLGTFQLNEPGADVKIVNGFLLIGINRHNGNDTYWGIGAVISPENKLIQLPEQNFRFIDVIGAGIAVIGRVKDYDPGEVEWYNQEIGSFSLFDLQSEKVIAPWSHRIVKYPLASNQETIFFQEKGGDEGVEIPILKIREYFEK